MTNLDEMRRQFKKDLVKTNQFYYPKPFCQNLPPEISKGWNACLSCRFNETCNLLFREDLGKEMADAFDKIIS